MKAPTLLAAGCLAALLSACATGPSIRSDYDQKADFSRYRTFGYMSPLGTDKAGYSSLLTERLKDATRGQMEMRGYVYNTADPDLLINFNGKLQQKTQVTQAPPAIGPYYGYRSGFYGGWPGYGWGDTVYQYTEGTLNIDLVDARRKQLVWEGVAVGEVRNPEMAASQQSVEKPSPKCSRNIRSAPAWPRRRDRTSPSLEESRMSTARPSASARPPRPIPTVRAARPRPPRPTPTARAAPPRTPAARSPTTRSPWCCRAAAPWGLPGRGVPGPARGRHPPQLGGGHFHRFDQRRHHRRLARGRARGAAARVLGDDLPADRLRRPALGRYAGRHVRGHSVRLRLAGHERPAVRLPCAGVRSAWFLQAALSAALPVAWAGAASTSFYDTSALADTLRQFVDFDLLNAGKVRASFGVVNVRTGNFAYFDSRKDRLGPEHVMASGALPPGFPSVEIDGEHYWDGGVVSNTPLAQVVGAENMRDTLAFQVDLWPARGGLPTSLEEVAERQKDIQYSSRTRLVTDQLRRVLKLRHGLQKLLARLPESERGAADLEELRRLSHTPATNIVNLIYESKHRERYSKDYEFGTEAMREHWESGLSDIRLTLARPGVLDRPTEDSCFVAHDIHRNGKRH